MIIQGKKNTRITLIETDYKGLAEALRALSILYPVCDNKELLDKCLEKLFTATSIINND